MKIISTLLMLCFVVILVNEEISRGEHCNEREDVIKHQNGTYERVWNPAGYAIHCGPYTVTQIEEWTDYPDNGGKFIRKIKNPLKSLNIGISE